MERDITVEMTYSGVRYIRTVRSQVKSALNGFMMDVTAAAWELRHDIMADKGKLAKKSRKG
jgi:hypothetical protein